MARAIPFEFRPRWRIASPLRAGASVAGEERENRGRHAVTLWREQMIFFAPDAILRNPAMDLG